MPQERDNPCPFPTAEEAEAAPGDRATKSARNIMVRQTPGIPRRPFLMGDNDHAPILQSVRELTAACWELLDSLRGNLPPDTPAYEQAEALERLLTDHGCPSAEDVAADKAARQAESETK